MAHRLDIGHCSSHIFKGFIICTWASFLLLLDIGHLLRGIFGIFSHAYSTAHTRRCQCGERNLWKYFDSTQRTEKYLWARESSCQLMDIDLVKKKKRALKNSSDFWLFSSQQNFRLFSASLCKQILLTKTSSKNSPLFAQVNSLNWNPEFLPNIFNNSVLSMSTLSHFIYLQEKNLILFLVLLWSIHKDRKETGTRRKTLSQEGRKKFNC